MKVLERRLETRPIGAIVRPMALVLAVAAAAALQSGCRGYGGLSDQMALMLDDPERRHAIGFDSRSESLIIVAPGRAGRLGHDQAAEIHRFMRRYKDEAEGRLIVSLPRSAGGHHATREALHQVNDIMLDNGIDPASVIIRRYHGDRISLPAIRLTYERPVAVAPVCGDWSEDVGVNGERIHYPNYGCATQRNLAASVDNARDLLVPRETTPRSSERRSATWKGYVKGKSSSAGASSPSAAASSTTGSSAVSP